MSWSIINSAVAHQFTIGNSSMQLWASTTSQHYLFIQHAHLDTTYVQRVVTAGINSEGRRRPTCSCQFSRLHACLKEPWQEGTGDINTHLQLLWWASFTTHPLTVCLSVVHWGPGLLQCWHITVVLLPRLEKWPPSLCWSYHEQTASSKHPIEQPKVIGHRSGVIPHTLYI